jgi:hypothetical protein
LETTLDSGVNLVLDGESLAGVLGVGLECWEHFSLLNIVQSLSRDNSDLLLLVELLVELLVFTSDFLNEDETLVLSQHGQEVDWDVIERSSLKQSLVKLANLHGTNTAVLGELAEDFWVGIQFRQVHHVLVDFVKGLLLRCSGEEHVSVATFNSVLVAGGFIVGSAINSLNVTQAEGGEKRLIEVDCLGLLHPWLVRVIVLNDGNGYVVNCGDGLINSFTFSHLSLTGS